MRDPELVVRSLTHWAFYVPLVASESFAAACTSEWHGAQAVFGMLAGTGAFIAFLTLVWSSAWFQQRFPTGSLGRRALLYGTRVRTFLSVLLTLCVLLTSGPRPSGGYSPLFFPLMLLALPDMLAGSVAVDFLKIFGKSAAVHSLRVMIAGSDAHQRAHHPLVGDLNSLLPTFILTLMDGFFLTLTLLAFSFVCFLILEYRARQNPVHPAWNPPSPL